MKKSIISFCCLIPLLMSSSGVTHFNELDYTLLSTGQKTKIFKVLKSGSSKSICKSHILENEAASVKLTYDFLEKHKDYAPYNGYKKSYHLIYRLDIYLNNNVAYKGGVGNWFDGHNPTYLNSITVKTDYKSSNYNNYKFVSTPKQDTSIYTDIYVLLKDINPTRYVYETNSYNYVKNNVSIGFDANSGYESMSYSTHWKDSITERDFNNLNSKLIAHMETSHRVATSTLTNTVRLFYGNKIIQDANGNRYIDKNRDDLYSGPIKEGAPFTFSIFGCENLQNDYDITSATFNVLMKTTHGSNVRLDTFKSDASIAINLL